MESRGVTWFRNHMSLSSFLIIFSSSLIAQVTFKHSLMMSQTSEITWFCPQCTKELSPKKKCPSCKVMTCWICTKSESTGLYKNLGRHKQRCGACNPMVETKKIATKRKLDQTLSGNFSNQYKTNQLFCRTRTLFEVEEKQPFSSQTWSR
jgi:hypothetical protein